MPDIKEQSKIDIASVIAQHEAYYAPECGYTGECACGWVDAAWDRGNEHPKHLAEVLVGLGTQLALEKVGGNTVTLRKSNIEMVTAWMESLGYRVSRQKESLFAVLSDNSGPRITIVFGAEITYTGNPDAPFTGYGVALKTIIRKDANR